MNIRIVSDSASDIFAFDGVNYASVPLKIITSEKQYVDNADLDVFGMTEDLKKYKGESKSSCPNVAEWNEAFQGCDAVFCVTITRNLSGSYNSATLAVRDFIEEDPSRKGYVIDTLTAGPECALIVDKLAALIAEGKSFEEIKKEIIEYKNKTHLVFCLESLRNLANNGRINPAIAKLTGVLGIRMVGKASLEGTLEVVSKIRGSEKAVVETYLKMKEHGYRGQRVRIHHCKSLANAEKLRDIIVDNYPAADVSIHTTGALCSFYAEEGGYLVGYEGSPKELK
ncbi:MAG: DegV family protein [Clostridia bacterium]|nr:DegV family protein [Clostridia bacterium]